VISQLAHGLLGSDGAVPWESLSDHNRIRETIASVVPGFEAIRDIEQTRKEFTIDGRTLHEPRFNMPEGKAVLHVHKLPPLAGKDDQLRLMTVRSEGQFNTVVYEEEDIYRGQDRRDVILLHPDDLQARGLKDRQWVRVQSETGQMDRIQVRSYEQIRSGNALMYYPEANVLISRRVDPASQTPAFKGALVTVQPVEA
jgi:anaerobic selenocysteine-containing dehydrogenase